MNIKCEKSVLLNSLSTAARAVSVRSTQPVMEGVLINAEEQVSITGYNMETGIVTTLNAEILETGNVVIPAKILVDIVRKMSDEMVTLSSDNDCLVHIQCGEADFRIMGLPAEQYPKLPDINQETNLSLTQGLLKSMLSKTLFAVSVNENKGVHTGSLFELNTGVLSIVALDGFRMAMRREKVESNLDILRFVAPGHALRELEHILKDDFESETRIVMGGRHIMFENGETTVISRLLDGEFLDYNKAIPEESSVNIKVNTRYFLECVERVSLLVNDKIKNPVRIVCEENMIHLSLHTPLGSATDRCPCDGGGEIEIGFNNRYVIDALKAALPEENVKISFNTAQSPCLIRPEEGDEFLFMVLPVRLKSE